MQEAPSEAVVEQLASSLNLPRLLCRILAVRGQGGPAEARSFLRPELSHLHDPAGLADIDRGAMRIHEAIRAGERIFVHGDYDVDGIASAALLSGWIRRFGGNVSAFVPHRLHDGYDFGPGGLAAAQEQKASLIVTCDCGIRALDTVRAARDAGIDVVVTDHHTPAEALPDALAVINPNRADCSYPNKGLAGAGVAFKLCQYLAREYGITDDELWPTLDLVGLASVADLVPLKGENRTLVRYGLRALARTKRPGLRALMEQTQVGKGPLEAGRVGFIVAPPINAAGRVADAKRGLALLETENLSEAQTIAAELISLNRERQQEDRRTVDEAVVQLATSYDAASHYGVVVAGAGWHPGVIGIVASRLVERIFRPVVVIAVDGNDGRGSARSIPHVDLFSAIDECGSLLGRYGGHRQAAGLDIPADRIPEFAEAFNAAVREQVNATSPTPSVRVDAQVSLSELTPEVYNYVRYFGPFGIGNPKPVLAATQVSQVSAARVVGSNHLKLLVKQDGKAFDAIGFGLADRVTPESLGSGPLDVAFQLSENEYQGRRTLQLQLKDVRRSVVTAHESLSARVPAGARAAERP